MSAVLSMLFACKLCVLTSPRLPGHYQQQAWPYQGGAAAQAPHERVRHARRHLVRHAEHARGRLRAVPRHAVQHALHGFLEQGFSE